VYEIKRSLAPPKSRGAAQVVLTGDEEFVRIARLAAARYGMYLDEYGLWRWHSSEEAKLESQSQSQSEAESESELEPDIDSDNAQEWSQNENGVMGGAGYWELVEGESEDRILDELELGAIAPQRRNFRFLTSRKRASARAGTFDFSSAIDLVDNGEG
jgi:DNA polymerase beta